MLKGREECEIYLTHVCRHLCGHRSTCTVVKSNLLVPTHFTVLIKAVYLYWTLWESVELLVGKSQESRCPVWRNLFQHVVYQEFSHCEVVHPTVILKKLCSLSEVRCVIIVSWRYKDFHSKTTVRKWSFNNIRKVRRSNNMKNTAILPQVEKCRTLLPFLTYFLLFHVSGFSDHLSSVTTFIKPHWRNKWFIKHCQLINNWIWLHCFHKL